MKKLIIVVGAGVIGTVLLFAFVDASVVTINAGERIKIQSKSS